MKEDANKYIKTYIFLKYILIDKVLGFIILVDWENSLIQKLLSKIKLKKLNEN